MAKAKKKDGEEVKLSAEEVLAVMQKEGMRIGLDIPEQNWYSTGNMAIDSVTGGGIPVGRICTFAGAHASGKTTTAVSTAKSVIESGRKVLFADGERTLDKKYFRSLGVDPDDHKSFLTFQPRTLEEAFNSIRKLTETGDIGLTIVDSIPALITEKERSGDIQSGMNLELPKLLRAALKQANDYCYENESSLILLNHLLEKVDITFGGQQLAARGIKQYTMPGGTGPYFYSSLIVWFKKNQFPIKASIYDPIKNDIDDKTVLGFKHYVEVEKNKVGKPNGITEVINILGEGFSNSRTAFEVLKAYGMIKKSGAWFSVKDERLIPFVPSQVQGEENFYQALFENAAGRGTAITIAQELLHQAYEGLEDSPAIHEPSEEVLA